VVVVLVVVGVVLLSPALNIGALPLTTKCSPPSDQADPQSIQFSSKRLF
jgi:hypothetical protein